MLFRKAYLLFIQIEFRSVSIPVLFQFEPARAHGYVLRFIWVIKSEMKLELIINHCCLLLELISVSVLIRGAICILKRPLEISIEKFQGVLWQLKFTL